MTPPLRDWPASTRVAAIGLALALTVDSGLLVRILQRHDVVPSAPLRVIQAPQIVARVSDDPAPIRQAANRTPFDAAPTAASLAATAAILQASVPAPLVRPKLIGTVLGGSTGPFVILELPDTKMQLVRIGERAGELRLRSVAAGEALFDDGRGGKVSLRTSRAGSGLATSP